MIAAFGSFTTANIVAGKVSLVRVAARSRAMAAPVGYQFGQLLFAPFSAPLVSLLRTLVFPRFRVPGAGQSEDGRRGRVSSHENGASAFYRARWALSLVQDTRNCVKPDRQTNTCNPTMWPVSGMYPCICAPLNVPPISVTRSTLPSFVTIPSTCDTALCICG